MVRNHYPRDHRNCQARGRDKSAPAEPRSNPIEPAGLLPDSPKDVASKEGRVLRLCRTAQKIPQLLVVFAFHCFPRNLTKYTVKSCAGTARKIDPFRAFGSRLQAISWIGQLLPLARLCKIIFGQK